MDHFYRTRLIHRCHIIPSRHPFTFRGKALRLRSLRRSFQWNLLLSPSPVPTDRLNLSVLASELLTKWNGPINHSQQNLVITGTGEQRCMMGQMMCLVGMGLDHSLYARSGMTIEHIAVHRRRNRLIPRKEQSMRNAWTSLLGLGACSFLGVLLLSDVSWAAPKKGSTYLLCKCTCRAEDELGKIHDGPSNGYWFTTSGGQCLGAKCKVGRLEGSTRDCLVTEKSESSLQQTPTTPGAIQRRGVEGEQPDSGMANPSGTSPETK